MKFSEVAMGARFIVAGTTYRKLSATKAVEIFGGVVSKFPKNTEVSEEASNGGQKR